MDAIHKKDEPLKNNLKEEAESLTENGIKREKINENKTNDSKLQNARESISVIKKPETAKINEKTQCQLFSSAESLRNTIVNTEATEQKKSERQELSSKLPVNKLTATIQNNNKKSNYEKIYETLQNSKIKEEEPSLLAKEPPKLKEEESLFLGKEPPKVFPEDLLFPSKNSENNSSFLSQGIDNPSGIPLPYTKNFKKKKSEDLLANFELKRIKENFNENSNSSIQSKTFFRSKRKFLINQPSNDAMQLTQSQKVEEIGEFLNKAENKEKNLSHSIAEFSNPFRHIYRKKEEREKLTGFACDQCEKVSLF